jgi:putative transposase
VSDAKRLKALEDENAKLKKLLAEAELDKAMLRRSPQKMYGPPRPCKVLGRDNDDSCVNVSGLSRVDCCCSQAMMRSARVVLK